MFELISILSTTLILCLLSCYIRLNILVSRPTSQVITNHLTGIYLDLKLWGATDEQLCENHWYIPFSEILKNALKFDQACQKYNIKTVKDLSGVFYPVKHDQQKEQFLSFVNHELEFTPFPKVHDVPDFLLQIQDRINFATESASKISHPFAKYMEEYMELSRLNQAGEFNSKIFLFHESALFSEAKKIPK